MAAASLAALYEIEQSLLFSWAVGVVAVCGMALSLTTAVAYAAAGRKGQFSGREKFGTLLQGLGNARPLLCYVVALLDALGILDFGGGDLGLRSRRVLTHFQRNHSVWWYARIWVKKRPSSSADSSRLRQGTRSPSKASGTTPSRQQVSARHAAGRRTLRGLRP